MALLKITPPLMSWRPKPTHTTEKAKIADPENQFVDAANREIARLVELAADLTSPDPFKQATAFGRRDRGYRITTPCVPGVSLERAQELMAAAGWQHCPGFSRSDGWVWKPAPATADDQAQAVKRLADRMIERATDADGEISGEVYASARELLEFVPDVEFRDIETTLNAEMKSYGFIPDPDAGRSELRYMEDPAVTKSLA